MQQEDNKEATLEALEEIRNIMDRSVRFISLSGWSGIWAGCTALAGSFIAYRWMLNPDFKYIRTAFSEGSINYFDPYITRFIILGIAVFIIAFAGGLFFTWKKAHRQQQQLWSNASRQMLFHMFLPIFAGGIFTVMSVYYGCFMFIVPSCLAFYGLALIGASRHTLSDIRYLGMLDVTLGCASLFLPAFGLLFWATGFGLLHILYGAVMWNKYDK